MPGKTSDEYPEMNNNGLLAISFISWENTTYKPIVIHSNVIYFHSSYHLKLLNYCSDTSIETTLPRKLGGNKNHELKESENPISANGARWFGFSPNERDLLLKGT